VITVHSKILKITVAFGKCQRISEERDASVITGEKEYRQLEKNVSVT
jgi:hypothetical protein